MSDILKHGEKNYAQELENSINVYSTSGQKNTLADNVSNNSCARLTSEIEIDDLLFEFF